MRGGEDGVVVKQPASLENERAEEEAVDGERVIWRCSVGRAMGHMTV